MALQYKDYYAILGVPRTASDAEHQEGVSQTGARIPSRCRQGQKEGRGEIQGDQRGLRSPERSGEAQALRRTGRELEIRRGVSSAAGLGTIRRGRRTHRGGGAGHADFEFQFGGTGFSDFFEQRLRRGGAAGQGCARRGFRRRGRIGGARPGHRGRHHGHARRSDGGRTRYLRHAGVEMCGTGQRAAIVTCPAKALPKRETYQVKIPAGVAEGQRLRLAGRGEAGAGGGAAGDLYLARAAGAASGFRGEDTI